MPKAPNIAALKHRPESRFKPAPPHFDFSVSCMQRHRFSPFSFEAYASPKWEVWPVLNGVSLTPSAARIWAAPQAQLPEVPRPRPDRVEMEIGDVDVPDPDRAGGRIARIGRTAAMEFIAASVGQGEGLAAVAD